MTLSSVAAILEATLLLLSAASGPHVPDSIRNAVYAAAARNISEASTFITLSSFKKPQSSLDLFLVIGSDNAVAFSEAMQSRSSFTDTYHTLTGRDVSLISAGVEKSSLLIGSTTWSGTSVATQHAVSAVQTAVNDARLRGYAPQLRGILFSEGEAEGALANMGIDIKSNYASALTTFIEYLRTELNDSELPVYIVQTGNEIQADDYGYGQVRSAQESVHNPTKRIYIVSRDAITFPQTGLQKSGVRYVAAGYTTIGSKAADNIVRVQSGALPVTSKPEGLLSISATSPQEIAVTGYVNGSNSCSKSAYELQYGDGSTESVQVTENTCGPYAFTRVHKYATPGNYILNLKDGTGKTIQTFTQGVE